MDEVILKLLLLALWDQATSEVLRDQASEVDSEADLMVEEVEEVSVEACQSAEAMAVVGEEVSDIKEGVASQAEVVMASQMRLQVLEAVDLAVAEVDSPVPPIATVLASLHLTGTTRVVVVAHTTTETVEVDIVVAAEGTIAMDHPAVVVEATWNR